MESAQLREARENGGIQQQQNDEQEVTEVIEAYREL